MNNDFEEISKHKVFRSLNALCMHGTAEELRRYISEHGITAKALNETHWGCRPPSLSVHPLPLPLCAAIQAENLDAIRVLLESGASPDELSEPDKRALRRIAYCNDLPLSHSMLPWWLQKYSSNGYRKKAFKHNILLPKPAKKYPFPLPDLPQLMAIHHIPLANGVRRHPLRIVLQQRAPNAFLEFGDHLELSVMETEFSCMRFLFPNENADTLEAWSQYVAHQEDIEWDLGLWDGPTAQGFVDFASQQFYQYNGGGRGWASLGFRTVWPSQWRTVQAFSPLEDSILDNSYYSFGQNTHFLQGDDRLPEADNSVLRQVLCGRQLERPDLLATEALYLAPQMTRDLVCQLGIPEGSKREFLEWLRREDAHPDILACLEDALRPVSPETRETLQKLLATQTVLPTDLLINLQKLLLQPSQQARLLGLLVNNPSCLNDYEQMERTDTLIKTILGSK